MIIHRTVGGSIQNKMFTLIVTMYHTAYGVKGKNGDHQVHLQI